MRKLIATLLCNSILFPFLAFADEEGNNSIVDRQIQYVDYNYIHNIENGALNPVSISDIPLGDITVISAGYFWNDGKYHNVDKSGHVNGLNIDVYGIARLDKISFEGEVGYFNYKERDKVWNSTLFMNKLNPFILADDKPSDYKTDRFVINGRFTYKFSSRFRFGLNADYNVGVMSDESDPRVETKGMRFILNPGVDFDVTDRFTLGATGGINLFSESQRYTCLQTAVNYKFYLMSGLGTNYPYSNNAYSRDSHGTSWFVSVDGKYKISNELANYLTINYGNESEKAVDGGSSYRFMGGDFSNNVLGITDRFAITGSRIAHNIEIGFQTNDVKGRWYDQKSTSQNGTTVWEIMNSSIKHTESLTNVSGAYRLDFLDNAGVSSLTAGIGLGYTNSDTKNYPELYYRKYSNLSIKANVTKYFNIKKVRLGVGIDGGYDMNLSSSCDLNGIDIEKEYSLPMYYFLTSNAYTVNGRIDGKLPVGKVILGAYITGGTTRCANAKDMFKTTAMNSFTCGLNLSF
ncbi:MAG: transporter [Muribaculaceae bacterium]|nr:transporter [Muribaculaceae bacterium]MDE6644428.1 transporter [Muribaculaceae bacterium]